jgi:AmmeMemoRadiSam system protein A
MGRLPLDELPVTPHEAELLLDLSEVAIRACLDGTRYPGPDADKLPESLRRPCGAFVTLHVAGRLNGCIGNINGSEPIGTCVGDLARKAAFEDPRLRPLRRDDLDRLHIEVSILSPLTPVPARTRPELIANLEQRRHGLILAAAGRRAVFLPSVWGQLPTPDDFIDGLLHKAGLPVAGWPADMYAEVFTTASVGRHLA